MNTTDALIILGIVTLLLLYFYIFSVWFPGKKKPSTYTKRPIMTPAEQQFFYTLNTIYSQPEYFIFPQVHFESIVNAKFPSWEFRKLLAYRSIDYIICDHNLNIISAIELDDKSHDLAHRRTRDIEVDRVMSDAGIPIHHQKPRFWYDRKEIAEGIRKARLIR